MVNRDQIEHWARDSLISKGYQALQPLENVLSTAWSSVFRIKTKSSDIYVKQMPKLLSLEAFTIQKLKNQFSASVPVLIDVNLELNCFLMQDGGKAFYHFKDHEQRLLWILKAIKEYRLIQKNALLVIDNFLDMGVPDWRLGKLPNLYKDLIAQEEFLKMDGLTPQEIEKLQDLRQTFFSLCDTLAQFKVAETLDHCDLHGGNILIDENTEAITIIDWGETVITHPYFSLMTFFRNLNTYYSFEAQELWNSCFDNPEVLGQNAEIFDQKLLEKLLSLVMQLEPIYSVLAFYRLWLASDKEKFLAAANCKGRVTKYLLSFLNQF